MQKTEANMTPGEHAQRIASMLQQAQQECRADIERIDDPKAQALFETIDEVLGGTMRALEHYRARNEPAWRSSYSHGEEYKEPATQHMPEGQRPQPPVVTEMAPDIDETHPPSKLYTE